MSNVYSQKKNLIGNGQIHGILMDTIHNYRLRSATVSVYNVADSALVNYGISDSEGNFELSELPVGSPMRLEVTHIGYKAVSKIFKISKQLKLDMGTLNIGSKEIELDDVNVSVAPISMNGDTLEINPSAFKLDSNAVVEDLLRKIPNITVWGDGTITVNGKEISGLLVNGRQFFTGDFTVATQNLPKNSVEKIQVYNKSKNNSNPADSLLEMNLKLKKGMEKGYFGKLSLGYGTNKRYELDGSLNLYSTRFQASLIAATNNANKVPSDVNTLITYSSFKGTGVQTDYMPDFRLSGVSQSRTVGGRASYDFKKNLEEESRNFLFSDLLQQHKTNLNIIESKTIIATDETNKFIEDNSNRSKASTSIFKSNIDYDFSKNNISFRLRQSAVRSKDVVDRIANQQSSLASGQVNSINQSSSHESSDNLNYGLSLDFNLRPRFGAKNGLIKAIKGGYDLKIYDANNLQASKANFETFIGQPTERSFNRVYERDIMKTDQRFFLTLPTFLNNFEIRRPVEKINLELANELILQNENSSHLVKDMPKGLNSYLTNGYLSNHVLASNVIERPSVSIKKTFRKSLTARFYQRLDISITANYEIFDQHYTSDKSFQFLNRKYTRFLPHATISYTDNQYGDYLRNYSITYRTSQNIPSSDQLIALTDSLNLNSLHFGNISLLPSYSRIISGNLNSSSLGNDNSIKYDFNVSAGRTTNNLTDSITIDEQNVRKYFTVNEGTNKFVSLDGSFRKVFKEDVGEFQIKIDASAYFAKTPSYLNAKLNHSSILNTTSALEIIYSYKGWFLCNFQSGYNTYYSQQNGREISFKNTNVYNNLSTSISPTKKFSISTNVSINRSASTYNHSTNYTIWNASLIYRCLKGNNLEIKMSALDILNQNVAIINRSSNNMTVTGIQNALRQYFLASISYYPRHFGTKKR